MSSRKQTPDVLGALLGGMAESESAPSPAPAPVPPKKRTTTPRKSAAPAAATATATVKAETNQAEQPDTPQWEYLEVVFRDYRGWKPMQENGRELGSWKTAPTIQDYLKQLGDAGWEMVNMSERYHNQKEAYFKRLKR